MPTNRIRAYLDARKELDRSADRVEKIASLVHDASKKLRGWRRVGISGAKTHHIPPEVQVGNQVINASDWPTLQQLSEAPSGWHEANARPRDAYMAIPKHDRGGLQPLPK